MSVERTDERRLQDEIARLVVERQDLRSQGASDAALEDNRRQLAQRQRDFSELLIDLYVPKREAA